MAQSTVSRLTFPTAPGVPLVAAFDAGRLTSDGGLPWLSEADRALALCATLAAYQGTLIVVSHDVQFVETLNPDFALPLASGAVRYFESAHLAQVAKV